MRKLILAIAVLAVGIACSSKSKTADKNTQKAPANTSATKDQAKAKAATAAAGTIMCTHNKEQRSIAVEPKGAGCEVMYTKAGETKSVATASYGSQHCQDVASKIEKNLTGAGYSCQ